MELTELQIALVKLIDAAEAFNTAGYNKTADSLMQVSHFMYNGILDEEQKVKDITQESAKKLTSDEYDTILSDIFAIGIKDESE